MLYCVLIESPEVLNIIQENHIKSIISLLDKHGRNHKVRNMEHCLLSMLENLSVSRFQVSRQLQNDFMSFCLLFVVRSWMCSVLSVCVMEWLSGQIRISSRRTCFQVVTSYFKPTLSIM